MKIIRIKEALSTLSMTAITDQVQYGKQYVGDAKQIAVEANQSLNQVHRDSLTEFQKFIAESAKKIAGNEKSISDFKSTMTNESKEMKRKDEEKIGALEQKNNDMKNKMYDYKDDSKEEWQSFRCEFNHDLDEFGKSFRDLGVSNVE